MSRRPSVESPRICFLARWALGAEGINEDTRTILQPVGQSVVSSLLVPAHPSLAILSSSPPFTFSFASPSDPLMLFSFSALTTPLLYTNTWEQLCAPWEVDVYLVSRGIYTNIPKTIYVYSIKHTLHCSQNSKLSNLVFFLLHK